MGVLIKGMKMPKNCDNCWALDDYGDYPRCLITEEQRGYNFPIREKRMDNCPLVEIPPHGRLIDADALNYSNTDYCGNHFVYMVDIEDSPVIIESENEDD